MTARARRRPRQGPGGDGPASMAVQLIRADPEQWKVIEAGYGGARVGAVAALFGHGPGVAAGIAAAAAGIEADAVPAGGALRVSAAPSLDPAADAAGTLYLNLLAGPRLSDGLARRLYRAVLTAALAGLSEGWPGGSTRVTWPKGDDVAAGVLLAAARPAGGGPAS